MTSCCQVTANRRNARLSTGPRSEAGRRRVSQNARSHGLSAPLPELMLRAAFLAMLEKFDIAEENLSARELAALEALVRADLSCRRAQEAENAILARSGALTDPLESGKLEDALASHSKVLAMSLLKAFRADGVDERLLECLQPDVVRESDELLAVLRYRSRAETARRKALRAWAAVRQDRVEGNAGQSQHHSGRMPRHSAR